MGTESPEEVGTILRSILTSEKSGIPLRRLEGEYRTLTGTRIPFQRLGFSTLEEYLESVPDVARFTRNTLGEVVVVAVVSESTAHVAQMVRGQKSTKPKMMPRKIIRRPLVHTQHMGYRPNPLLTTLSRGSSKSTSSSAPPGERRRAGYEVYRPPSQRGVTVGQARQSNTHGYHKQETSSVQKSGTYARNSAYSAFASEHHNQPRYEAPPRFHKAEAPRFQKAAGASSSLDTSSNTAWHEESKPKVVSAAAEWPVVDESPKPPSGGTKDAWGGELNNSWVPRPSKVKSAAEHWEFGIGQGDTGDSSWGTAGPATVASAAGESEEPAQPVATATPTRSLSGTPALELPAVPAPAITPSKPVVTSRSNEQRATIEPDQARFNPFRQPLQLDLLTPAPVLEETASMKSALAALTSVTPTKPVVPTSVVSTSVVSTPVASTLVTSAPVSKELGISLRSAASTSIPKTLSTSASPRAHMSVDSGSKELGISLQPSQPVSKALTRSFSQPVHISVTGPTLLAANSFAKELGISLQSLVPPSELLDVSQPVHVPATAPVNRQTLMPSGPVRRSPAPMDMEQPSQLGSVSEPDPQTPNCQLVLEYARREGLRHLYSAMRRPSRRKKGPPVWLAVLRLGDRTFLSYPEETTTAEEAKEIAAARAVTDLRLCAQAAAPALPVTPASTLEEVTALVNNIVNLVIAKPTGILKEGIAPCYEMTFGEQLPTCWFEHVVKSGLIRIERGQPHCILYPLDNTEHSLATQNGNGFAGDQSSSASNSMGEPETFIEYIDVIVTYAKNTKDMYFRFLAYDEEYNQMVNDMAAFYSEGLGVIPDGLQVGEGAMYATFHEGKWVRVEPIALHDGGLKIECCFVDEGPTRFLAPEALYQLEKPFIDVSLQAIPCQLDGLAQFSGCEGIADIMNEVLVGKKLVAEVMNSEADPVSVVMYDTNGPDDVDLNNVIFQRLMGPKFPIKGCVGRCYLSHIRHDGLIWVQMNGNGLGLLDEYLDAINQYCKGDSSAVDKPELGKVYAAHFRADLSFYRAVLTSPEPLPSGELQVRFVDFGNEDQVYLTELRNMDNLGDFLVRLPHQALECRLRNFTCDDGFFWTEKTSTALLDIIGSDNPELLVKVTVPPMGSQAAVVELFKRHPITRHLTCINTELSRILNH